MFVVFDYGDEEIQVPACNGSLLETLRNAESVAGPVHWVFHIPTPGTALHKTRPYDPALVSNVRVVR